MYGIGIGDDGEAYEVVKGGYKKVADEKDIKAQKAKKAKADREAQNKKKAQAAKAARRMSQKAESIYKRKAHARRKNFDRQEAMLAESSNEWSRENQMRGLPGIGDGLAGFGSGGEFVQTSGTDFGGIWGDLKAKVTGVPASESTGSLTGDALEALVKKIIESEARFQQKSDEFFALMKKAPASPAKTLAISNHMKMMQAHEELKKQPKSYYWIQNYIVSAVEKISPKKASRVKMLFDNPWMTIKSNGSLDKALEGYDDGLGVAPLLIGAVVVGTVSVAGAAYASSTNKASDALQKNIEDWKKIIADPNVPESVKVEAAKSITKATEALSSVEREKQGGITGGLTSVLSQAKWLLLIGAAAFIFIQVGIPMIKARQLAQSKA
jgi:hypothetical protein